MERIVGNAENVLEECVLRLEEEVTRFSEAADEAAEARADFKHLWGLALVKADGPMDLRKAKADVACHLALQRKERAEAAEKKSRVVIQSIEETMGAARTIMASSRV